MLNPSIFKRYDIRGKYPEDIDPRVARELMHLYVKQFQPTEVVVGHDPVEGSAAIYEPICDELQKLGVKVCKAGMVATPMLYFASAHYNIRQGLMLTASHLGQKYTGIKIVIDGVPPKQEEISAMKDLSATDYHQIPSDKLGESTELADLKQNYIQKIKSLLGNSPLNRYKIVIDSGNGPSGDIINNIAEELQLNCVIINQEIKARDLAHESNPKVAENRQQLANEVQKQNADLGIIWDGDGDRAYFIDHAGEIIPPEFIGVQIGSDLIKSGIGTTMTVDVRGSAAVEKEIEAVGGHVKRIEAWHVPIKFEMDNDPNIVFGMETSGHYVFRDMYKSDDGLLASMSLLKAVTNAPEDLKTILNNFRNKYLIIEEINFETSKTEDELVEEINSHYPDGLINKIDGITVDYPEWRFNVRASRTEPIIRLNISGQNFEKVKENLEKLKGLIGGSVLEK